MTYSQTQRFDKLKIDTVPENLQAKPFTSRYLLRLLVQVLLPPDIGGAVVAGWDARHPEK